MCISLIIRCLLSLDTVLCILFVSHRLRNTVVCFSVDTAECVSRSSQVAYYDTLPCVTRPSLMRRLIQDTVCRPSDADVCDSSETRLFCRTACRPLDAAV